LSLWGSSRGKEGNKGKKNSMPIRGGVAAPEAEKKKRDFSFHRVVMCAILFFRAPSKDDGKKEKEGEMGVLFIFFFLPG